MAGVDHLDPRAARHGSGGATDTVTPMRRRPLIALLPLALLLPACSGGEEAAAPADAMRTAQERFEQAGGVHIELSSSGLPQGQDGVSKASGDGSVDAKTPAFSGEVTGVIDGTAASVEIIAVGAKTWMSFFSSDFNPVDMSDLGAPNPAEFFRTGSGVGQVVAESTGVTAGERTRDGDVVLQSYTGSVPAKPVQDLFLLGEDADTFEVTYGVEPGSGELRTAEITGEFYAGETTTYTVDLSEYGKDVTVEPPA